MTIQHWTSYDMAFHVATGLWESQLSITMVFAKQEDLCEYEECPFAAQALCPYHPSGKALLHTDVSIVVGTIPEGCPRDWKQISTRTIYVP